MAFLTGPRQVGKTTSCRRFGDVYLNWDIEDHRELILQGPGAVASGAGLDHVSGMPVTVVLDASRTGSRSWSRLGLFSPSSCKTLLPTAKGPNHRCLSDFLAAHLNPDVDRRRSLRLPRTAHRPEAGHGPDGCTTLGMRISRKGKTVGRSVVRHTGRTDPEIASKIDHGGPVYPPMTSISRRRGQGRPAPKREQEPKPTEQRSCNNPH
jgi:hypothetical protein